MLPPFVPPTARPASEPLPPITDFLVDETEQAFEEQPTSSGAALAVESADSHVELAVGETGLDSWEPADQNDPRDLPAVTRTDEGSYVVDGIEYSASLPSIEEFVARSPYVATEVAETPEVMPTEVTLDDGTPLVQLRLSGSAAAENVETPEASEQTWENAEDRVSTESSELAAVEASVSTPVRESPPSPPTTTPQGDWLTRERDSFDWQSVATLAGPSDEDERAEREWLATDWDAPSTSPEDHAAATLMQLARRVRSGELKIEAYRGMSTEAALAAVLTALLTEPDTDQQSHERE